jgi:hypothetical protein
MQAGPKTYTIDLMAHPQILLLGLSLVAACSSQGPAQDATVERALLAYGEECFEDQQCSSGLCVDSVCSRECKRLADCPPAAGRTYDCGEVQEKSRVACYPRRSPAVPYAVGHDCSLDLKCAVGYRCLGQENTTDRYCSRTCANDRDCPPRFRCAQARVGIGEPEPDRWCRRRELCHPCVIDDQCGTPPQNLCVRDAAGRSFCSRACDPAGSGCPAWARCEDAGNGQFQCKPRRGACYHPEGGGLCDHCITFGWVSQPNGDFTVNEVGTCKAGSACYLLSKMTAENVCLSPCAPDGTCPAAGGGLTYACFELKSLAGKYCLPTPDGNTLGTCSP